MRQADALLDPSLRERRRGIRLLEKRPVAPREAQRTVHAVENLVLDRHALASVVSYCSATSSSQRSSSEIVSAIVRPSLGSRIAPRPCARAGYLPRSQCATSNCWAPISPASPS